MIVLQKFGFKESKYERPQDAWVCGHLADGKPCELGPGPNGRCRVTTACQPRLENGRWECRRSPSQGGPCAAGPLPDGQCCLSLETCVPRPSLRMKRKRGVLWATALMIGILAVALGSRDARQYMMPGKLSTHHAGLTDCSACHAGGQPGQIDLLHRFVTAVRPRQNSNLCLTCHDMGAQAFAPHTHPVDDLRRITETIRADSQNTSTETWMQRITFSTPAKSLSGGQEVHCATCHEEHEGTLHDLKVVSNARCQICHVSKYGSFADSHPQFVNYAYERRTRIIFDHVSHMGKYFPDAVKAGVSGQVAPKDCTDCHQQGVRQKFMIIKSFDTMCSGCHSGDITGTARVSGTKGIDFITAPGLDLATLNEHGVDIGNWPKQSEAGLTPFMRLILDSNGNHAAADVAGLDLLDLSKANDAELARVAAMAWAVKKLFSQLLNAQMAAQITASGEVARITPQQTAALTGGLSHDVILAATSEWFPNLDDDLQRHDRGEPTRDFKPPERTAAAKPSEPVPSAGSSTASGPPSSDDILAPAGNSSDNKNAILAPPSDVGGDNNAILAPPSNAGNDKNAILAPPSDNNSSAILTPDNNNDILSGSKSGDASGGKSGVDSLLSPGADEPNKTDEKQNAGASTSANTMVKVFDPESWADNGGWYRQDFTIRYRPSGHADRFLQAWLDYAGSGYGAKLHDRFAPIFGELSSSDAVGRCTKCHSVDDEAGAKSVNWQPFDPNGIRNRFTNFSHQPHIELLDSKTCVKCHELKQTENLYLKTYESGNPTDNAPNFTPLQKSVCANCHSQQASMESCTLCHGYHVKEPIGNRNRLTQSSALP